MRVVNLARRPFVNRRPVVRMAILLWVVAALLVLANLRLFSGYLLDSREIRGEIAETEGALATEERGVDQQSAQVRSVNLGDRNRQALFLNSLISYRTFPWSTLFDDLEQVLPHDVRLQAVRPVVRLASEQALSRAEQQAREEAREQRRSRRRSRTATNERRDARPSGEDAETPIAQDEVKLELRGAAKNEESLILLVDTLYQNPAFRSPFLRNESMSSDASGPAVFFSIEVLYRTGKRFETQEAGGPSDQVAEAASPAQDDEADEAPAATSADPAPVVAETEAPAAGAEATAQADAEEAAVAATPPPPPAAPPQRTPEQRTRDRQLDEELAAARRAAAERANEEEAEQNAEETEREPVVDARRKRLEELRERARRRRESREATEARNQARVVVPGAVGGQQSNPPRGGQGAGGQPTGTGGAARPPAPPRDDLNDDPGFAETPASGSPTLGGGMASLSFGTSLAKEVWA